MRPGHASAPRPAELRTRPPSAKRLQMAFRASEVSWSSSEVSTQPDRRQRGGRGLSPERGR